MTVASSPLSRHTSELVIDIAPLPMEGISSRVKKAGVTNQCHNFMIRNKKIVLPVLILFLVIGVVYLWLSNQDIAHNGREYSNRSKMCYQLAIDYLRNIRNDPSYTDEKWNLAVDIETEITNLCQLELSEEAASKYAPKAIEKYKTANIADRLRECLPKSDMASKEECDLLLNTITSFEDCVNAGFPVMESYPERCNTPDGKHFINQ